MGTPYLLPSASISIHNYDTSGSTKKTGGDSNLGHSNKASGFVQIYARDVMFHAFLCRSQHKRARIIRMTQIRIPPRLLIVGRIRCVFDEMHVLRGCCKVAKEGDLCWFFCVT